MKSFSYRNVELNGGYLFDKQKLNRKITIKSVYDRFDETGRIGAFNFDYKEGDEKKPHIFWDSDVAKWMEGAAYILAKHEDPELEEKVEALIDRIEENQWDDGYFNIYYTVVEPTGRFTVRGNHELYCAGHLIEAAVAYAEATGRERFLHLMEKYAMCIKSVFMHKDTSIATANFETPGHQEIELALLKLYNYTKNKAYLELAAYFINTRGTAEDKEKSAYNQSHIPVREQSEAVGHAVRALYLYSGMASLALETGDQSLIDACKKIFDEIAAEKTYLTGAFGATRYGEAFGPAYALPNETAYAETCASIAMVFFAKRMLELENNSKYADMLEIALYNGALSGLSLDGKSFFYENPLEISTQKRFEKAMGKKDYPITQRVECFGCSCCPPNLNRLLAGLGDYIYGQDGDTLYVNQYASSTVNAGDISVSTETEYPRSGAVKILASGVKRVALRIPAWCNKFTLNKPYSMENGYAVIENDGSIILLDMEMPVRAVYADPRVTYDAGKLAIMRGPIVYCAEAIDNGQELSRFVIEQNFEYEVKDSSQFGLPCVEIKAKRREYLDKLYSGTPPTKVDTILKLIPYSCFANRGESDMLVFINGNY